MDNSRASHILWSEGNAEIAVKLHTINLKIPPLETRAGNFFGLEGWARQAAPLLNHVPTKVSEGIPTIVAVIRRTTKAPDGFCPTE